MTLPDGTGAEARGGAGMMTWRHDWRATGLAAQSQVSPRRARHIKGLLMMLPLITTLGQMKCFELISGEEGDLEQKKNVREILGEKMNARDPERRKCLLL